MTGAFFAPTSKTDQGTRIKVEKFNELLKVQEMLVYFGKVSYEAVDGMVPFERDHFAKTVEEIIKKDKPSTEHSASVVEQRRQQAMGGGGQL